MRLSRGRKGDGSVDREFRPYGNIMEGLNALRSRIPSTVVASTASTAATLKPVMAAIVPAMADCGLKGRTRII